MPVGYQKVDGGDGEEEGEGGGEDEKGQELQVMNGNAGGAKEAVPKSKVDSKPRQSHAATKVYKASNVKFTSLSFWFLLSLFLTEIVGCLHHPGISVQCCRWHPHNVRQSLVVCPCGLAWSCFHHLSPVIPSSL